MIDDTVLDEMMADLVDQKPIHRPTKFWERALEEIGGELKGDRVERFRGIPSTKRTFVPSYQLESLRFLGDDFVDALQELPFESIQSQKGKALLDHFSTGAALASADYRTFVSGNRDESPPILGECSESEIGAPDERWEFEGKFYSRSMLNYLNGLVFLKQNIDTHHAGISRVLEVGGGFGSLGEILYNDPENDYTYVDVDIPPTAYVSSYYLENLYPEGQFFDYRDAKNAGEIEGDTLSGKAAVICPWQLEHLTGTFDLFVNFISFQEMEPEVVEHYLDHMKRLECRFVLLRNLREGKPKKSVTMPWGVENPIKGEDYDTMLESRGFRVVATNVTPFGFKTVDGFHSELRLYERIA